MFIAKKHKATLPDKPLGQTSRNNLWLCCTSAACVPALSWPKKSLKKSIKPDSSGENGNNHEQ